MVGSMQMVSRLPSHHHSSTSHLTTWGQIVHGAPLVPLEIFQIHQLGVTVIGQLVTAHAGVRHGAVVVDSIRRALRSLVGWRIVGASVCSQRAVANVRSVVEPRGIESVDRRQIRSGD